MKKNNKQDNGTKTTEASSKVVPTSIIFTQGRHWEYPLDGVDGIQINPASAELRSVQVFTAYRNTGMFVVAFEAADDAVLRLRNFWRDRQHAIRANAHV